MQSHRNECKLANFWSVATCACIGNSMFCPNGLDLVVSVSAGVAPPRCRIPGVLSSRARVVARFWQTLNVGRRSTVGRRCMPQQPTAVAAIIPYTGPISSLPRRVCCACRRILGDGVCRVGERYRRWAERTNGRRRMHTLSRLLGTGDDDARTNALCVYICRCSSACVAGWRRRPPVRPSVPSSRVRAPYGGRHTRRSCRPAVRSSVDRRG